MSPILGIEDFITDDIIDRYWELYRIPGNRQAAGERWTVDREPQYADRIGENYFAKHADGHQWYLYPGLTRDEALLIKQWDSAGKLARSNGAAGDAADLDGPCTFSFHSSFEDPTTPPNASERWSIEVRCVAFYD